MQKPKQKIRQPKPNDLRSSQSEIAHKLNFVLETEDKDEIRVGPAEGGGFPIITVIDPFSNGASFPFYEPADLRRFIEVLNNYLN